MVDTCGQLWMSRSLEPTENNYSLYKLEFMALKWAVVDKLRDYLYGADFINKTDNNPLTHIDHRWLVALSEYNITQVEDEGLPKLSKEDLWRNQWNDLPDLLLTDSPKESHLLQQEWDWLQLHQEVVYRRGLSDDLEGRWQLFLPGKRRETV